MTDPTEEQRRADLEARIRAGEWLLPGEVALVFGRHRSTIQGWINRKHLGTRQRDPISKYREVNPADVVRLLDKIRQEPES